MAEGYGRSGGNTREGCNLNVFRVCFVFCFVLTERLVEGFCAVWPGGCRSVSVGGEFVENLF